MRGSTSSTKTPKLPAMDPDSDSIHGIDESVGLQSVADVTAALALTIAGWCGLESVGSAPDGETFWA